MKTSAALAGGLAGTLTVASIHETFRRVTPDAPRIDLLNIDLIRKSLERLNKAVPADDELQRWAVGGELFFDTAYYSLAGVGGAKGAWTRGTILGLLAGVTAVVLPKPLGLTEEPSNKTTATRVMTVALYLMGGLAAAAITQLTDTKQPVTKDKQEDLR